MLRNTAIATALLLCAVLLCMALPGQTRAAEMDVNAKSALLMDAATGTVLFEKNAHEALAPASVTKIMTKRNGLG